jgi:ABC-type nickel/cobalt efflux system permease component RcnA
VVFLQKTILMSDSLLFLLLHADHDHHHFLVAAPFLVGLIASILHVVSGPDHLAAVTPLAIDNKLKAWLIGLGWGAGHTTGMLLIGLLFIFFRHLLPIEAISAYSEILVALVLIGIGVWALWKIFGKPIKSKHAHPHTHTDESGNSYTHVHEHEHPATNVHQHVHKKVIRQSVYSAFTIGTIHGLAGIAHLLGMLPALAFPTVFDSAKYLIGFGIGTIGAMVAFSVLLGFVSYKSQEGSKPILYKSIQFTGAMVSIVVGVYWMYISV